MLSISGAALVGNGGPRKLVVYTDGAARGNPGESASGFEVYEDGKSIFNMVVYNGVKTNNYAEYNAIIKALEWCAAKFNKAETSVELFSDSDVAVNQINGKYKVKSNALSELNERVRAIAGDFSSVTFRNVPREAEGIKRVDKTLNRFLDTKASSKHKA